MNAAQLAELEGVKETLRSIVLSSPTVVDARGLGRDFFSIEGERIPHVKFGYHSLLTFLKERCNDCLLLSGDPVNPTITPIVTERTKHINDMISRQKVPSGKYKYSKPKRSSVMESQLLSAKSQPFTKKSESNRVATNSSQLEYKKPERNWRPDINSWTDDQGNTSKVRENSNWWTGSKGALVSGTPKVQPSSAKITESTVQHHRPIVKQKNHDREDSPMAEKEAPRKSVDLVKVESMRPVVKHSHIEDSVEKPFASLSLTSRYNILYLNNTKSQLQELMDEHRGGVWLEDLNELYKDKFEDGIDFCRLGYCDLAALLRNIPDTVRLESSTTPGRLVVVSTSHAGPVRPKQTQRAWRSIAKELDVSGDSDDALPGVPYDEGIFPEDCMGHREIISPVPTTDLEEGNMYEINVSEVLDPSHFWFQLRSEEHDLALEKVMDEMMEYYSRGEGRTRTMEFGAVQIGQFCATNFDPDGWHRSIIVQITDSDHVKVRHVDYGTVTRVARCGLRVLLSRWATLPAQALRGCLANVRPGSGLSCWPYKTAKKFHNLVNCVPLVAQVHSVDHTNHIIRLYLTDTTKEEDVYINNVLVMEGNAEICDMNRDILEDFLLPPFDDVENGVAMNLAEKDACVAAGVFPEGLDSHISLPVRIRSHTPAFSSQCQENTRSPQYSPQESHQVYDRPCTSPFYQSNGISHFDYPESESTTSTVTGRSSVVSSMTFNLRSASQNGSSRSVIADSTETLSAGYTNGMYESSVLSSRSHTPSSHPVFASFKRKIAFVKPNSNADESTPEECSRSQELSNNRHAEQQTSPSQQTQTPRQSPQPQFQIPNISPNNGSVPNLQYYSQPTQYNPPHGNTPMMRYPPGMGPPSMPPPNMQPFMAQPYFQPPLPYPAFAQHMPGPPYPQYSMGPYNTPPPPHPPSPPNRMPPSSSVQSVPDANLTLQIIQNTLGLSEIEMQMFLSTQRTNPEIAKKFMEEKIRRVRHNLS